MKSEDIRRKNPEASSVFDPEGSLEITLSGERVLLLPEKAAFMPDRKFLLLSDLHIGKSSHFRREGIAVPSLLGTDDFLRFGKLVSMLNPERVIIIGDLFHTGHVIDTVQFREWREEFSCTGFLLIKGNHDRLSVEAAEEAGIELRNEYRLGSMILNHIPKKNSEGGITICGHIHPGVRISGKAKQSVTLPCFFHTNGMFILPAFGEFTGLQIISPSRSDEVFGIVRQEHGNKVVKL